MNGFSADAKANQSLSRLVEHCFSIDLEVGRKDNRIHEFAAVRGDTGESFSHHRGNLNQSLLQLDAFSGQLQWLLGHNLIAFDIPFLRQAKPDLRCLNFPPIDTLRLNPLAFPLNPYHHLVKHYQNGQLMRARINDPELDARLTLELFQTQLKSFVEQNDSKADLLQAWHWLTTREPLSTGFDAVFSAVRGAHCPTDERARHVIGVLLMKEGCSSATQSILDEIQRHGWGLAYAMAWLSVAGGNSVMPPWVCHQFPQASELIARLRDQKCMDPECAWCVARHNPHSELKKWFPHISDFRPEPKDDSGRPMQLAIIEAVMAGDHVLGVLPTGTGKSICYQLPALSRYDKTGALTLVISPLVALMADQVSGLEKAGIVSCAAINGLLSMPERADVLDRVRLGDIGILLISPEQLRNRSVRRVLDQRSIGMWVLDEAHCISKWGHDFRPDYRYVGKYIRQKAGKDMPPPVLCLTATAKPDVIKEMMLYFRKTVGIEMILFNGGASRRNLVFDVIPTKPETKFSHVWQILETELPLPQSGGAIVYCSTRAATEELADFLKTKGMRANYFHSNLSPEFKKNVQDSFIRGELRVIVATNAFGMGIDKPDVRLVIHADIPGSLENYLQEAGRAGRDRENARCVLLYTQEDVERQFMMSARSRLTFPEIRSILKTLRKISHKANLSGKIVATTGEILREDTDDVFVRDKATDDTRVKTAVSWLEEATLLRREENDTLVFPSSLKVNTLAQAEEKLSRKQLPEQYKKHLLEIVNEIILTDPEEGISTDEIMGLTGLSSDGVRKALNDLEQLGLATNDTALTAFVHVGVERSSLKRLKEASELESDLIKVMQQYAPDLSKGDSSMLRLSVAAQKLKEMGHLSALPDKLGRLVRGLINDGRSDEGGNGSVRVRRIDPDTMEVFLQRDWVNLIKTAELRRTAADVLLKHFLSLVPAGTRGVDLLTETTLGKLMADLRRDIFLGEIRDFSRLLDYALLWLHEQDIIRLNKGLAIFRSAMTIQLEPEKRNFGKEDYAALQMHYNEQVLQIHIMAEYVQRGLAVIGDAIRLSMDYFSLSRDEFIDRWLPDRQQDLERQTTPQSWQTIVESLNNPVQQRIVADEREQTNVLVLAGPGSGKTRVLVHRIAWLIRVKRENSRSILALAYNRHAATEIRIRLKSLIGDDAKGVVIMTCHALAMRLAGFSFTERLKHDASVNAEIFRDILQQAVSLLNGTGLLPEEADEQRERLLAGFRWILVDEYQDIGLDQYELIAALAGRSLKEKESKLSLFAVGDDDQNIYAFSGASVEFIRRFEHDYSAKGFYLTDNYRSTAHIIEFANLVIAPARERMKVNHPIQIDRTRRKEPLGGVFQWLDPVTQGRVAILPVGSDMISQAYHVMEEMERRASLDPEWSWDECAVIAREWKWLEPVRAYCEWRNIPVQIAREEGFSIWRLHETQALVKWIQESAFKLIRAEIIQAFLQEKPATHWWLLLGEALEQFSLETDQAELPVDYFIEWLVEWGREIRRRQTGLLLLTAHRSKGLEFKHVAVLDGAWVKQNQAENGDEARRLYYVAATRASQTLLVAKLDGQHPFLDTLPKTPAMIRLAYPTSPDQLPYELKSRYQTLSLSDIDIGYAGRYPADHPIHGVLESLAPGDPLQLVNQGGKWLLQAQNGMTVGRLAAAWMPPRDNCPLKARVIAVLVRCRADASEQFQDFIRAETWRFVVPELIIDS